MSTDQPGRLIRDGLSHRVTFLELFFDLVFVYGLSQVTAFLANEPTPAGFAKGLLLLGLLWWAWVAYSWLGTSVRLTDGWVRLAMFAAVGMVMIVALSMPYWYDPEPGFSAALVAASAYVGVRALHVVLYYLGAKGDAGVRAAVQRLSMTVAIAAVLLIGGALVGGVTQVVLVAVALAIDLVGPFLGRGEGWTLAPAHFVERHQLIVIIALGESIVAVGVGAAGLGVSAALLITAMLAVSLSCVLWLTYFDRTAEQIEHALLERSGLSQITTARDAFSYLHFGLVAGLVLIALAMKSALPYSVQYGINYHFAGYAAVSLGAGFALFLLTLWAIRQRSGVATTPWWFACIAGSLLLMPLALTLPIWLTLLVTLAVAAAAVQLIRASGDESDA